MDPQAIATQLTDAAVDAWTELPREGLGDIVAQGADGTPTTFADQVLDDAILEIAADLGISTLTEESGFTDHGSDVVAVVDPLDGSRNAARGIPHYCTSIAVGPAGGLGSLQAGVIHNLATGQRYAATVGEGATLDGQPMQRRGFDASEVMVGGSTLDDFVIHEVQPGQYYRDLGSAALDMALVAQGALDVFLVRREWLRVIDIAAGTLIVREAGGLVLDPRTSKDLMMPFDLKHRGGMLAVHHQTAVQEVL